MVTACKAESENGEIQDKVRARSVVVTDSEGRDGRIGATDCQAHGHPDQGWAGQWLLECTKQPLGEGLWKGCNGRSTPSCSNSHNGRSDPGQTTLAHRLLAGHGMGALEMEVMDRVTKGLVQGGRAQLIGGTQILSNALGTRGGATWPGNVLPQQWLETSLGELRECGSPPTGKSHARQQ